MQIQKTINGNSFTCALSIVIHLITTSNETGNNSSIHGTQKIETIKLPIHTCLIEISTLGTLEQHS